MKGGERPDRYLQWDRLRSLGPEILRPERRTDPHPDL